MSQEFIWQYFQNEGVDAFPENEGRIDFLVDRIAQEERVLNIGIGNARFEQKAVARGVDVFSVDPDARAVNRLAGQLGVGHRARTGYGQDLPFPDSHFEVVVASEVFEHLNPEDLDSTLSEIVRVLVQGGRLLVTVPARENLRREIVVCPDCGHRFHRWGHEQSFDGAKLRRLLAGKGFKVDDVLEREFVNWSSLNWKGCVAAVVKRTLNALGIHGQGENIFAEARYLGEDSGARE